MVTLRANNFIPYIFAILGEPSNISKVDARQFLSEKQADLLWFAIKTEGNEYDLKCSISEIYHGIVLDSVDKQELARITEIISELPELLECEEMDRILYDLSIDHNYDADLLLKAVSQRYISYPEVYSVRKMTLSDMVEYLMKTKYLSGLHPTDDTEFKILTEDLQSCFAVSEEISQGTVVGIVNRVGILCDRGTYIAPSATHVDPSVLKDVNKYIESQVSRTTISYNELFERFKDRLEAVGIHNPHYLHGLLNHYGCPYSIGKDYVYKTEEYNFDDDFIEYVKENYPISISSLAKHFVISDAQCKQVIDRCKPVITKGAMVFYRP